MKSIRLLPVVIFAALALLVFKAVGLATNGGYVLAGTETVAAAEAEGGEASMSEPEMSLPMPSEAVLTDPNPTLTDIAPTLATRPEGASEGGHETSSSESSKAGTASPACPENPTPPPSAEASQPGDKDMTDKIGTALATSCPPPNLPKTETGDVVPSTKDGSGKIVPLAVADGQEDTDAALLQRLGARRAELDKREADLAMRESIVAAAEQKLDERTKQLEALQAQVDALVNEKQAAEDASFKAVVSMYETMKPKEAARIFDTLDLEVLLKVARAMNPRKMSPILAAMSAQPAQALTTALAATADTTPTEVAAGDNLAALPQIVGH